MKIELTVTDPDVIEELAGCPTDEDKEHMANQAMLLGMKILRHVRDRGDRETLSNLLTHHLGGFEGKIEGLLGENGRLHSELNGLFTKVKLELARIESKMDGKAEGQAEVRAISTLHGLDFEDALAGYLEERVAGTGDTVESTGATTGSIKNCKVGDHVLQLGPDHVAAGSRIVFEAKEDRSYNMVKALEEIEKARKNRKASHGVFVFSKKTAPAGLEVFKRVGGNIFVVWDAEDPTSNVALAAAVELASYMAVRAAESGEAEVDLVALEQAIDQIEAYLGGLDDISTWAGTIKSSGDKIEKKATVMRGKIEGEVERVRGVMNGEV